MDSTAGSPQVPAEATASTRSRVVTALAVGAVGFLLVRRLPRPLRAAADLALAASAPPVAAYLTRLGL